MNDAQFAEVVSRIWNIEAALRQHAGVIQLMHAALVQAGVLQAPDGQPVQQQPSQQPAPEPEPPSEDIAAIMREMGPPAIGVRVTPGKDNEDGTETADMVESPSTDEIRRATQEQALAFARAEAARRQRKIEEAQRKNLTEAYKGPVFGP